MSSYSIVNFRSASSAENCGYCNTKGGSWSDGMWAQSLTVGQYQQLIDRGWRRCGHYLYKPRMETTCCPAYTIKCLALEFQPSKSQKKVLKKLSKYLVDGVPQRKTKGDKQDSMSIDNKFSELSILKKAKDVKDYSNPAVVNNTSGARNSLVPHASLEPSKLQDNPKEANQKAGADPGLPPCRKAKTVRRERRLARLASKGLSADEAALTKQTTQPWSLEQLLPSPDCADQRSHKLQMKLVLSDYKSKDFLDSYEESYQLYRKYQKQIHNDSDEECNKESFKEAYVDSPLQPHQENGAHYGLLHQQYWLDGRLVAVGIIDVLPLCVSSVYFYYDPDLSFLSLGTFSALREIGLVRELHQRAPSLQFYYMGFYIHSCVKMRYKGQFQPSLLLCPATYTWHPIEKCRPLLDSSKFCIFQTQQGLPQQFNIKKVPVLCQQKMMHFSDYKKKHRAANLDSEVQMYVRLVGVSCSKQLLLFLLP